MGICLSNEAGSGTVVDNVDTKDADAKQEKMCEKIEGTSSLIIKVVSCRGLRNADWTWLPGKGVSDAYVIAKAGDMEILRTKTIPNTLEPYFNEEFECSLLDSSADITFEVFDADPGKPDDKLGRATLKKESFGDRGFNGEIELVDADKCNKAYIKVMVKAPGGEYPGGPAAEFKVTLPKKKKNEPVGFDCDTADPEYLFIVSESFTGPAKEHNEKSEATEQLKKMQSIFAVNGVSGNAAKMEKELKAATEVVLTIRRPQVFTVAMEKKGAFGTTQLDAPTSALISKISEDKRTCVQVWNEGHPAKEVKVGDRVITVNGQMGKGKDLTEMMKADGQKQIVICRPASPSLMLDLWLTWF
jgi:preprotein translocase subunit YajC